MIIMIMILLLLLLLRRTTITTTTTTNKTNNDNTNDTNSYPFSQVRGFLLLLHRAGGLRRDPDHRRPVPEGPL